MDCKNVNYVPHDKVAVAHLASHESWITPNTLAWSNPNVALCIDYDAMPRTSTLEFVAEARGIV